MAERNEDAEMLTIPDEPGSSLDLGDDQEDSDDQLPIFHTQRDLVWDTICKYIGHLSHEEIFETRRLFCGCVNSIIDAYEEKLREVQALKNKLKVREEISKSQGEEIQDLKRNVIELTKQLASKVCEDCGEKRITEQLSSLTMQENTTETAEDASEIDGGRAVKINIRKRPREVEEYDEDSIFSDDEDSTKQFADVYKCKYSSCGLSALLHMIYKMKINFCPSKLVQMIGKVKGNTNVNCTHILKSIKDKKGYFLDSIHAEENIEGGKQQEALNRAGAKFMASEFKQKAGILSYETESYKHCLNIYRSKDGKWKIYDANSGRKYIKDLHKVHYLEVVVLTCDKEDGVPNISKRWSICHARHCKKDREKLVISKNSEISLEQLPIKDISELEPESSQ